MWLTCPLSACFFLQLISVRWEKPKLCFDILQNLFQTLNNFEQSMAPLETERTQLKALLSMRVSERKLTAELSDFVLTTLEAMEHLATIVRDKLLPHLKIFDDIGLNHVWRWLLMWFRPSS